LLHAIILVTEEVRKDKFYGRHKKFNE
jgi:hypothetical protein